MNLYDIQLSPFETRLLSEVFDSLDNVKICAQARVQKSSHLVRYPLYGELIQRIASAVVSSLRCVHEHPVVPPHVSHFKQVPLRTIVKFPHSGHASPT